MMIQEAPLSLSGDANSNHHPRHSTSNASFRWLSGRRSSHSIFQLHATTTKLNSTNPNPPAP
eukprot:scaffold1620_cov124-Skeletonema_menzelii.AAC.2